MILISHHHMTSFVSFLLVKMFTYSAFVCLEFLSIQRTKRWKNFSSMRQVYTTRCHRLMSFYLSCMR